MRRLRLSLVATFLVLATAYGFAVPAWEAPDEVSHMAYVEHLLAKRSLPIQRRDLFGEEHQAPLYYALAAVAVGWVDRGDSTGAFRWNRGFGWDPGRDVNMALHEPGERSALRGRALALRLVRTLSTLFAAGTVILTMTLAATVTASEIVALLAASLVAFNPQFLFLSASANNDNLLTLCFTGCLLQLVRIVLAPDRSEIAPWLAVGAWWSAALLAKMSAFSLAPVIAAALVSRRRRGDAIADVARAAAATGGVVAAFAGWWLLRNQLLYGDPLGYGPYHAVFGALDPLRFGDLPAMLVVQFQSFWGWFGWVSVPAPRWFYLLVAALTAAALIGIGRLAIARRRAGCDRTVDALLVLALAVVVQEVFQLRGILTFGRPWTQGRYLFPILPAAAVLAALGIMSLVSASRGPMLALGVSVLLLSCAIYLLIGVILPAYA